MRLSKYKSIFPRDFALLNFVTNRALNTKLGEVENKIRDISKFVTNSALNRKIGEIEIRFLIMTYILLLQNVIS